MLSAKPAKPAPNSLGHLTRDRGYRWTDRDPVLEEICDIIDKSHLTTKQISTQIAALSHGYATVKPATIDKWLAGKVKKPHNWTISWVAAACGWERIWRRI